MVSHKSVKKQKAESGSKLRSDYQSEISCQYWLISLKSKLGNRLVLALKKPVYLLKTVEIVVLIVEDLIEKLIFEIPQELFIRQELCHLTTLERFAVQRHPNIYTNKQFSIHWFYTSINACLQL